MGRPCFKIALELLTDASCLKECWIQFSLEEEHMRAFDFFYWIAFYSGIVVVDEASACYWLTLHEEMLRLFLDFQSATSTERAHADVELCAYIPSHRKTKFRLVNFMPMMMSFKNKDIGAVTRHSYWQLNTYLRPTQTISDGFKDFRLVECKSRGKAISGSSHIFRQQ